VYLDGINGSHVLIVPLALQCNEVL